MNLSCLWATREQCLSGRGIDEAKKRNLDDRDGSVDHRRLDCGISYRAGPGRTALGGHTAEKRARGRALRSISGQRWVGCREAGERWRIGKRVASWLLKEGEKLSYAAW